MSNRNPSLHASYAGTRPPADRLPEVVFFGRSNAGKSTLINRLAGVRNLARVGKLPGKTRYHHFFRLGELMYLVDLPGYGYSAAPRVERDSWGALVAEYVKGRGPIAGAVLVVDARRPATELDLACVGWWREARGAGTDPLFVAATKADKLNRGEIAELNHGLASTYATTPRHCFIISARSSDGVDALQRALADLARAHRTKSTDG